MPSTRNIAGSIRQRRGATRLFKRRTNPLALRDTQLFFLPEAHTASTGGARQYTLANSESHRRANEATFRTGGGDFMVGAFVYSDSHSGPSNDIILCFGGGSVFTTGTNADYALILSASKPRMYVYDLTYAIWGSALNLNTWYFVAGWYDSVGDKIYVSVDGGTPTSTSQSNGATDGATYFHVSGRSTSATKMFDGRIARAFLLKPPTALGDGSAGTLAKTIIDRMVDGGTGLTWAEISLQERTDWGLTPGNGAFYIGNEASGNLTDSVNSKDLTDTNTVTTAAGPGSGDAADGDPLDGITDLTINAKQYVQATRSKQPQFSENQALVGGKNCLLFSGGQLLALAADYLTGTEGLVSMSIHLTSLTDSAVAFSGSNNADDTTGSIKIMPYEDSSNPNVRLEHRGSGDADSVRGSTTIAINTTYVLTWTSDGSSYSFFVNDAAETEAAAAGSLSGDWWGDITSKDVSCIGCFKASSENAHMTGYIRCLVACSNANSSRYKSLIRWLAHDAGVTLAK